MTQRIKGVLVCLVAVGLVSGLVGRCCCAQPAPKACCGKRHSAPAKAPCPQMVSCRVAVPNETAVGAPALETLSVALPVFALPSLSSRHAAIEAAPECGPPERPRETFSGLSPPAALLG